MSDYHSPQNNWWHIESGWIGFGEKPFDDREIGLLWEIGFFENKLIYLDGNRYRYEPHATRRFTVYASKGLDGKDWQHSCYNHEADTVGELRAWIEKQAHNMARGYAKSADYHQGLKKCRAAEAERIAAMLLKPKD